MRRFAAIFALLAISCLLRAGAPDYYDRAEAQYYAADYPGAITIALEGLAQQGITPEDEVELWSILGSCYARLGAFDKAAEYMILCYEYDKSNGDARGLTSSLINLASMYVYAGNAAQAEGYALEAIENERTIGRPDKLAMAYGKACDVYHALGRDTTALHYADLAVALSEEQLDRPVQAVRRSQRAYPLEALGRYDEALQELKWAETVFREADLRQNLSVVCFQLAQEYGRQGRSVLERQYLREAADLTRELGDYPLLQKICSRLAQSLKGPDPALAFSYLEEASAIQDSISRSKSSNALELFNIKYETARREHTIAVQNLEIARVTRQKQAFTLIIIFLLIVAAVVTFASLRIKRSERRLRQSNEQKDFLFRVISHDIHSPAVAQLRGMQMLRAHNARMSGEELGEVLLQLERQAESEVELIDNVLRWARSKSGSVRLEAVRFVLDDLVKEVVAQHAGSAQSKGIAVELHSPGNVVVCSVRSNLMLAVRKLLSNAIKFSPKGATVEIILDASVDGAVLCIRDHGIGIPEDRLDGIFDTVCSFRRSGTDGEPSNGLGLTVSRALIEETGSGIGVQSREGEGSCFTIFITNLEENA